MVEAITAKLIRRHPHVFGDGRRPGLRRRSRRCGAQIKADERRLRAEARKSAGLPQEPPTGALGRVSLTLPALSRALKLQEKAANVGFDWNDVRAVLEKLREEIAEVEAELSGGSPEALSEEVGDLLFAAANLARHLNLDPEAALRAANAKFERRFAHIEHRLAEGGRKPESAGLDEMEALWVEAKERERRIR